MITAKNFHLFLRTVVEIANENPNNYLYYMSGRPYWNDGLNRSLFARALDKMKFDFGAHPPAKKFCIFTVTPKQRKILHELDQAEIQSCTWSQCLAAAEWYVRRTERVVND